MGVMSPTPERETQRAGAIAAAVAHAGASKREGGRPCPWCAETIKPAARVCRYCGRDVEPLDILEITEASWQKVQDEFPSSHPIAMELLDALPTPPERPADWTRELCNRIEAGSVPEAAAARIPLDWSSAEPTSSGFLAHSVPDHESSVTDLEDVASNHPVEFAQARSLLARLPEQPSNPAEWLDELCKRVEAGSPPDLAAERIPLDWAG